MIVVKEVVLCVHQTSCNTRFTVTTQCHYEAGRGTMHYYKWVYFN